RREPIFAALFMFSKNGSLHRRFRNFFALAFLGVLRLPVSLSYTLSVELFSFLAALRAALMELFVSTLAFFFCSRAKRRISFADVLGIRMVIVTGLSSPAIKCGALSIFSGVSLTATCATMVRAIL